MGEPVDDDRAEALIEEARQRPRRRRVAYGVAAVVVGVGAVAALSIGSSDPSPPRPPSPTPLGAPLVAGPDPGSTLLGSWGQTHTGYVFVYGDGRVIWYPDSGAVLGADGRVTSAARFEPGVPVGTFGFPVVERRLSRRGLELVRAGQIAPKDFLLPNPTQTTPTAWPISSSLYRHDDRWAEPTAKVYAPPTYAICFGPLPVTQRVPLADLPKTVHILLAGRQRAYDPNIGTAGWTFDPRFDGTGDGTASPLPRFPAMDCFEVTAAEASTLYEFIDANFWTNHDGPALELGWIGALAGSSEPVRAMPIYPHGQPVIFGG